ncbi:rhodanese-like domain-containing protein [Streptomyces sp. NPDC017936]|uniref:rhodanese-like domain-containing protein n=1 Tax=Streptomyces sp. NPDC017936 TaxID=3365016 RepID=UPI00379997BA
MSLFRNGGDRVTVGEARRRARGAGAPAVPPDAREQDEWNAGHAPGTVHAPLSGPTRGAAPPGTAQGRPPVVIRRSGHRSRRAARPPARRGAGTADVESGMNAWAAAGHPVVDAHGNDGSAA